MSNGPAAKSPERFLPHDLVVRPYLGHPEDVETLDAGSEVEYDRDTKTLTVSYWDGEWLAVDGFDPRDLCTAEEYAELVADRSTEVAA